MDKTKQLETYYNQDHPFRGGIAQLRRLALKTGAEETFKWSIPVYTVNGKNVFGICKFKTHFGIWFFNGVFLTDTKQVLENAQEGKTKGMRHWKFTSVNQVDDLAVLDYMNEAIENQTKGLEIRPEKSKKLTIPDLLHHELEKNPDVKTNFKKLSPYKQKEFCEYIAEAKQEKTKLRRLEKILPMIKNGVGLNDGYR
ncbi:YdeI/OmpD-associated family protein [Flagellimonas okinawensis]|uniref:YdeI/OmpD-associated family protein n=1 Tax=Flagellimonas okinawensis TaxID=3031324 RepID=A0ABT5XKM1_9FLAO|nr:YdeI/OmpD-associated family protein [[Muricauda] okinawensis]MDF0706440.1 YdeI/OmpD-associated family protein [[Muricauda] okinawensis]